VTVPDFTGGQRFHAPTSTMSSPGKVLRFASN
jgi:hypothetical protein